MIHSPPGGRPAPLDIGEVPERSKGADCKSAGLAFGGSNPPLSTMLKEIPGRTPADFSMFRLGFSSAGVVQW